MESIISASIGAIAAVIACIINNNTLRAKTQHTIEMHVAEINALNEKNTAVISERLTVLSEQVRESNAEQHSLIHRMYEVEGKVENHGERITRLEGYHK